MRLTKTETIVLRETFLFHHMSDSDYLRFTGGDLRFSRGYYQPGETVELPRETEHALGVVISGRLHAAREPKLPDQELREGFVLGALDLFSKEPPKMPTITALEESQLLLLSEGQLRGIFDGFPELMLQYIRFLTGQIQALRWEHSLATSPGESRLLQLLSQHMVREGDVGRVALPYSISVLAGRLGMSRATLYRTFDRLEAEGVLRRSGKDLVVLRPEALEGAWV